MRPAARHGNGPLLAVAHTRSLGAPGVHPRDRQLRRRMLDLGGTEVVHVVAGFEHWLATNASRVGALVVTDLALAARVRRAAPHLPLVIDVDELPSVAYARTALLHEPVEHPGYATMLRHVRDRDVFVLEHAAVVIAGDAATVESVRTLCPDARVELVAPSVPCAPPPALRGRAGVAVIGSFASEPGLPDETLLASVAAACRAPVHAAGLDVAITRRALAAHVASVSGPDQLDRVLRAVRVAAVSPHQRALIAELSGTGVPTVVIDDASAIARLDALLRDDRAWIEASDRQQATARAQHDPDRQRERCRDVLHAAAIDVPGAAPSRDEVGARRRAVAGTLAAVGDAHEAHRREVQPDALLRWQHALYTNLDLQPDVAWRRWLRVHHDVQSRRDVMAARAARLTYRPLVSVVMPVHDPEPPVLRAAVDSVRAQLYDRWQLCIADDGSTRADTRALLDSLGAGEPRVRFTRFEASRGIAAATNAAIALASGSYVAFLDHDDVLAPDALLSVVRLLERDPALDLVYTDEDKLDEHGARVEPFCKPDWSPDLLLSCNYMTHLLVVRRALLDAAGGLRAGFDGAQDYDLVLRLTEHTDRIGHVSAPLYSWRKSPGSTAADISAKPAAHDSSRRAVEEAIARRGLDARVQRGVDPTWHRVRYRVAHRPLVTVVIPTRDRVDLLEPCVELVRASVDERELELLVVDNESSDAATVRYLERFGGRVVRYPHRFNYARQMNLAALEARGEVLLLLNNDARPASDGWFDAMLEHALRPEVGAVGARLRFPDGRAQHEGIVLNAGGVALNLDAGRWGVLGENIRNVAAVTGAAMMVRSSVWHEVGGMDERLRVAYNDVDLCLRIGECGWRVIYTPVAELRHAESSSRGSLHPEVDEAFFQRRWGPPRTAADPFFNPAIELLVPFSPRL